MGKKSGKKELGKEAIFNNENSHSERILKKISKEDELIFERLKELVGVIRSKYNLSTKDIVYLTDEKEILIPVSIFTKKLSSLESICKYLREELNLSYHKIGLFLNRNERNIWHTYNNSRKKYSDKLKILPSKYFLPISIFQNKLSILENIVLYLKDELKLSNHLIATLLKRDDRTIWTMYQRGRKKTKK